MKGLGASNDRVSIHPGGRAESGGHSVLGGWPGFPDRGCLSGWGGSHVAGVGADPLLGVHLLAMADQLICHGY